MKPSKILILTFLCLAAYLNKTYAQSDYVINTNNDTIKCRIKGFILKDDLAYRINKADKYTKIDSNNIIEYFIARDTLTYVLKKIPGAQSRVYTKRIEKGKINLYENEVFHNNGMNRFGNSIGTTEFFLYAGKLQDTLVQIKHAYEALLGEAHSQKKEKNAFLNLFLDAPSSREKFESEIKNSYSYDDILKYIHGYNEEIAYNESNKWDYLITPSNDTVFCKIKYDFISKCYFFRPKNQNNNYNKVDSSSAKEFFYSIENATYLLKKVPEQNQKVFVKWIEKGKINLFEKTIVVNDRDEEIIKYYWYVNKDNGELITIKTDAKYIYDIRSHKELLSAFRNILSDNKNILKDFNDDLHYVTFNTDIIIHLYISKYNTEYLKSAAVRN